MNFLNNLFNNIKNKFNRKKELPASIPVKNAVPSVAQEEDKFFEHSENIYETPSLFSIHSNIVINQSRELSLLLDMAYVAATADNSFYLPRPYKIYTQRTNKYEDKYNADISFVDEYLKKHIKVSKKLDTHSQSRQELYDKIKTIYPDFCHDMDEKISPEDYEFYKKNKIQLKKCLAQKNEYSNEISSHDQLLQYQDNLAKLIDTLDFSKACKIEDSFVLSELKIFFEKYSELSPEEQTNFSRQKIKMKNGNKISVLSFAEKLKKEREERIEQYSKIEDLYTKLGKQSSIRLTIKPLQDEEMGYIPPKTLHSEDDSREQ